MNHGMLEYWNIGIMGEKSKSILFKSLFHPSIIPIDEMMVNIDDVPPHEHLSKTL
jgi:hypothetical protein